MIDVMLDLETLGTKPGSVILSIGAVVFGDEYLNEEFYVEINQGSSLCCGLIEDSKTLQWWSQQEGDAKAVLDRTTVGGLELKEALDVFTSWLHSMAPAKEICLWGNGSDFDNVLLKAAYDAAGLEFPTRFYNNRCFRTLKNLGLAVQEPPRKGVYHNALDDAKHQARWAKDILANLRLSAGALAARKLAATHVVTSRVDALWRPSVAGDGN